MHGSRIRVSSVVYIGMGGKFNSCGMWTGEVVEKKNVQTTTNENSDLLKG